MNIHDRHGNCVCDYCTGKSKSVGYFTPMDIPPPPPSNKSGYKGVHKSSRGNKYISQIMVNGRRETLGSFNTPEEANEAYQQVCLRPFKFIYQQLGYIVISGE